MLKGTWKISIKKSCNGVPYGIDEYFIDGIFEPTKVGAVKKALDEAQAEGFDEFDSWEIIRTEFIEDF